MRLIHPETLATMTIWAEARGEPWEGKVAVGEVIRERMRRRYASDGSVEGTVLRSLQFSCWNGGDPNRIVMFRLDGDDALVRECLSAWTDSEHTQLVRGAVHYFNPGAVVTWPVWSSPETLTEIIGHHRFYRTPL